MVVEGVETEAQAAWFASLGCPYAQGFYFARPLDPVAVEGFLAGSRARSGGRRRGPRTPSQRRAGLRVVADRPAARRRDSA
jgi:sensor c-di-GMP phosphodiesterase-like protein